MANFVEVNWGAIKNRYVMGEDCPTFDSLCSEFKISKPTLIKMANDTSHSLNCGKTWKEQRDDYYARKQSSIEKSVDRNLSKMADMQIKIANSTLARVYKIINKELEFLEQLQIVDSEESHYSVQKWLKMSDLIKMLEVVNKYSQSNNISNSITLVLNKYGEGMTLKDLSSKQLEEVQKVINGEQIIDGEFENVQ